MAGEQPEFGAAMAREEPELACQHAFTVSKARVSRMEGPLWGGPADHQTSALPQPGAYLNHPPRLIKFSILSPCPKSALLSCPLPSPIYLPFVSSLSKGRKDGHPESRDLRSPGSESSIPAIQDSFDPGNMGSSQEGVSGLGTTLRIPPSLHNSASGTSVFITATLCIANGPILQTRRPRPSSTARQWGLKPGCKR